jgi:CRP-like cAMP-binding protein
LSTDHDSARAASAKALEAAGAARISELEMLLEACRRHREIAEKAVDSLSTELAEARGEIAALELGNGNLAEEMDELEEMAKREKEEDRDVSDAG